MPSIFMPGFARFFLCQHPPDSINIHENRGSVPQFPSDTTATSHGGNARRKGWMTPFPASSILRETKRLSGKVGPG
jgi:hypothetical protein